MTLFVSAIFTIILAVVIEVHDTRYLLVDIEDKGSEGKITDTYHFVIIFYLY